MPQIRPCLPSLATPLDLLPAIILIAAAATLGAQESVDQCAAAINSPGDVELHLSLKNGQTVFREGEMFTLHLEYTADAAGSYIASTSNYDRSGRLEGTDVYCLDPDAGTDPLKDYFNAFEFFMGGGLFGELDIGKKPFEIDRDLNEFRSLPPGSYHLSIVGNRVKRGSEKDFWHSNEPNIPVRSNSVDFEIVEADPEWQAAQLNAATKTLDSADASDDDKRQAASVLRYLGSEASTRELARRYLSPGDKFSWEMKFGLFGSPHRAVAIDAMKAELRDSEHPVTQEYVDTLVRLEMQSDQQYQMPQYDPNHPEEFNKARKAYEAELNKRVDNYMSEAAETAAASQSSAVRAISASEILQSDISLSPEAKARFRQILLASWDSLPVDEQNDLIAYRWDEVGGPEWLPVLESIVAGEPNPRRYINRPDRGGALYRINEIAPDTAHELILAEIMNPQGDVGIGVLGLLPERVIPQVDAPMIALIEKGGEDIDYQLLDRYGTAHALQEMKGIYEQSKGRWACEPESAMLHYFLRVAPEYGVKQVSDAIDSRGSGGCVLSPLTALKEYTHIPQIEALAIATLDNPSPEIASDAAQALQNYGSAKAEGALWARMEKFHNKYKDLPDEALHSSPGTIEAARDSGLEQALVQAISGGQAWFADAAAIEKLKALSSPVMQNELDRALDCFTNNSFGLELNWGSNKNLNYTVGWYQGNGMAGLKEKLAQFPAGAHFSTFNLKWLQEHHSAEYAEIRDAIAANEGSLNAAGDE